MLMQLHLVNLSHHNNLLFMFFLNMIIDLYLIKKYKLFRN